MQIYCKVGILGARAVWLKKTIWKMLKYYTYRLFSQQKDFNCQVANAICSLKAKVDAELTAIKKRTE